MTDDIKDLLSRSFGQEPPLRIDRDEVIQQGRKRLRRRRLFEAGSVVAAVVLVAVGATTLTNLSDSEQQMPPAASRTQSAPPGPELPLPSATTTTTSPGLSSGAPLSPPNPSLLPVPSSFPSAQQLTMSLYDAGFVTRKDVLPALGSPDGVPAFQREDASFAYKADVYKTAGEGSLQVTVDFTTNTRTECSGVPTTFGECTIRGTGGLPVSLTEWRGVDGERRVLAVTVRANGTRIAALASNVSSRERKNGTKPDDTPPVLSGDELSNLIVKVSLGAS
jgi:hypothetical protein